MITEVKNSQETRTGIREGNKGLTADEKRYVRAIAFNFVDYLEQVQRMPLVLRLAFYRLAFHLFDLLRRNGQLGRRVGGFDPEIREMIRNILSEKLVNNGTRED